MTVTMRPRLRDKYDQEIVPVLRRQFNYANVMQVPRLTKIVVNVGLGEAIQNGKLLDSTVEQVAAITGQRPVITRARKSIANFKLRTGMPIGCMATLRGSRMWEFFDRLVNVVLPRVRDFKGVSPKAFDGRGNYAIGIREQIIFPEIDLDAIEKIQGLGIVIATNAATDEEARALLELMGVPFRR